MSLNSPSDPFVIQNYGIVANPAGGMTYVLNFLGGILSSDLTFSRASNATLFNSAGNLVWAPANLVYPSLLDSGVKWTGAAAAVSVNSTTAPNGTLTAALLSDTVASSGHTISETVNTITYVLGQNYTFSAYFKAGTATIVQLTGGGTSFGTSQYANFDLAGGVLGTYGGNSTGILPTITSVGNGWYRCSFTIPVTSGGASNAFVIALTNNNSSALRAPSYVGSGKGVYVWGAQTEINSSNSPQAYNPTTTAAYYGARFDYDPSTSPATLRGLLLEEARTNVFLNSQVPVTQGITVTAQAYTLSFYGTGSIALTGVYTGNLAGTGANNLVQLTFTPTAGSLTCTVSGSITNVQLEAGSFATSRIVTIGSAATRSAESLYISNISNWFNATQGTLFSTAMMEGLDATVAYNTVHQIDDGTVNNGIQNYISSAGASAADITVASSDFASSAGGSPTAGTTFKIALSYAAAANLSAYNGSSLGAGTFGASAIPTLATPRLDLGNRADGSRPFNGWLRSFAYANVAKAAVQLQTLTTL